MTVPNRHPNGSPLPGGGPWLIEPDCPSDYLHNTAYAARLPPAVRCKCPRALWARRQEWRKQDHQRRKPGAGERIGFPLTLVDASTPDLTSGHCVTGGLLARKIMDDAYSVTRTVEGFAARERAKSVCLGSDGAQCPALSACNGWVTKYEDPAGSWGGVYAGKDQWERAGVVVTIHSRLEHQMRKAMDQEKGA